MSDLQRAMAAAASRNPEYLERLYTRAVELGLARERDYEQAEREQTARARGCHATDAGARDADLLDGYDGPHRAAVLVALAAARLGHVALEVARLDRTDTTDDPTWELALVAARDTASSTLGLTHLALHAHAQAVGYHASPCVGHTLERARATLLTTDPNGRHATDELAQHTHRAAFALSAAARAIRNDDVRVTEELATGLGQVLVVFAVTSEAQPV